MGHDYILALGYDFFMINKELPASVIDRLENKDKEERTNWMSFYFKGKIFNIFINDVRNMPANFTDHESNLNTIQLVVSANSGFFKRNTDHVKIFGRIEKKDGDHEWEFKCWGINNLLVGFLTDGKIRHKPKYVGGIAKETIKQLLSKGGITRWVSSENFLDGGEMMYEALSNDSDLVVIKKVVGTEEDDAHQFQYTISLANN